MASREFVFTDTDDGDLEITYRVQVSGDRAELIQQWEAPWDNENGTGPDIVTSLWVLSTEDFKKFVEGMQQAIAASEAFEKKHPQTPIIEEVDMTRDTSFFRRDDL